jgi:DNA ligase 1
LKELVTLYARDSKNRTKQWGVYSEEFEDGTARYVVTHGLMDGKKQSSPKYIKQGKNIGKSNETTPYEQACSDAQSKWNKQIDKGYVPDPDNIPWAWELENYLPMLAHKYEEKGLKHIKFPCAIQPKLDGFRGVAGRRPGPDIVLWSRARKTFSAPNLIIAELEATVEPNGNRDGEIYRHDWRSPTNEPDFQRMSSAAKKRKPDTDSLEYHVYDRPIPEDPDATFYDRFYKPAFIDGTIVETEHVKIVETIIVNSFEEIMEYYELWTSGDLPYEGLMVRNLDSVYSYDNRSVDLLKIKPLDTDEFEIIGGKEATGRDEGTVVFLCVTKDGVEFDSRPKGSYEQRAEYFTNLDGYVGQMLMVEFNGYTNSGIPRFNRGVGIRPDWDIS